MSCLQVCVFLLVVAQFLTPTSGLSMNCFSRINRNLKVGFANFSRFKVVFSTRFLVILIFTRLYPRSDPSSVHQRILGGTESLQSLSTVRTYQPNHVVTFLEISKSRIPSRVPISSKNEEIAKSKSNASLNPQLQTPRSSLSYPNATSVFVTFLKSYWSNAAEIAADNTALTVKALRPTSLIHVMHACHATRSRKGSFLFCAKTD
jgi:hypothetical protein